MRPLLGEDLEPLTRTMPAAQLSLTFNAQRALHAHHLASWTVLRARRRDLSLDGAIGHSVGVVAALVAAQALSVEDSCIFVRERASAFADICAKLPEPHGMMAVFADGLEENFEELERFPGVSVALHNSMGKAVIAGPISALQALQSRAEDEGWDVKFKALAVQGPYHTRAFEPCRERLRKVLASLELRRPSYPVFMGTSGRAEDDPARMKDLLAKQPCTRERHLDAVRAAFAHGCRSFLEVAKNPQPIRWLNEQLPEGEITCESIRTADLS